MKITRTICGEELVITLSNKELNEAYREQKRIFDINDVAVRCCTDGILVIFCIVVIFRIHLIIIFKKKKSKKQRKNYWKMKN